MKKTDVLKNKIQTLDHEIERLKKKVQEKDAVIAALKSQIETYMESDHEVRLRNLIDEISKTKEKYSAAYDEAMDTKKKYDALFKETVLVREKYEALMKERMKAIDIEVKSR